MTGEKAEKRLTKKLNKNKSSKYWDKIDSIPDERENVYAIHITKMKESKIIGRKVQPKADVAFAEGEIKQTYLKGGEATKQSYLESKNFYLDEEDKEKLELEYIEKTGISVKKPGSEKYTITKMNPVTFEKVFGSTELGAGASVYCKRKDDIKKNKEVLRGWNTSVNQLTEEFSDVEDIDLLHKDSAKLSKKKEIYGNIKEKANRRIREKIENNPKISSFIFKGEGNFKEPFTAQWIYQGGKLENNGRIPFCITTGSGRHRGDYTVVIKPRL